jgi:hypothetical protein
LHELVGTYAEVPDEVVVGIEVDRGLIVSAPFGPGYAVDALNPMAGDGDLIAEVKILARAIKTPSGPLATDNCLRSALREHCTGALVLATPRRRPLARTVTLQDRLSSAKWRSDPRRRKEGRGDPSGVAPPTSNAPRGVAEPMGW